MHRTTLAQVCDKFGNTMTTPHSQRTFHARCDLRRPRIAVSACLYGEQVRYDGTSKQQPLLRQWLDGRVDWQPICPEVAAGMGVPRPPVALHLDNGRIRVIEVAAPQRDFTAMLTHGVAQSVAQLGAIAPDAIVLKARSPSCGLGSTPMLAAHTTQPLTTDGLFAAACRERFPSAALCDEEQLQSTAQIQRLAIALLVAIDITHAATQQAAVYTHYRNRGFVLNEREHAIKQLQQQLENWAPLRLEEMFGALYG